MWRNPWLWTAAALAVAASVGGMQWTRPSRTTGPTSGPPNVLLITLDTTRADRLGAYGYAAARTPALDRLAASGVLFERAVTAASTTLPAHASVMTGRNPAAHGVRNNGVRLEASVSTLANAFREAGYRTAAFVSAFVLDDRFGLARGFDLYDDALDPPTGRAVEAIERRGDRTVAAATAWLAPAEQGPGGAAAGAGVAAAPFLLWVHLYDPHDPYVAPGSSPSASASALYDAEVAFADTAVATLLAVLDRQGLTASTLVAVVGDHGESLGAHGEATHGLFVYDATMRVPLLLAWPQHLPAGTRVAPLVRSIDLAPTLLDLAGRPPLDGAAGMSLVGLLRGTGPSPPVAYGETYFPQLFMNWAPLRSLRDGQWTFIEAPTLELYDLTSDPDETTNLATREPDRAGRMRRALYALMSAEGSTSAAAADADRDTQRKLAALGYGGSAGAASAGDPAPRPDPKAMIGVFNALRAANGALESGDVATAAEAAHGVLRTDPRNAFALLILGNAERLQGRYGEAAGHLRGYLEQVPLSADAHHWLAICQLQLGDLDTALAEAELALAIDPRFAEARMLRGDLLAAAGRVEEGIHDLRAAVNLNPDRASAHVALGRALAHAGQAADAAEQFAYTLELAQRFAAAGREPAASLAYQQLAAESTVPPVVATAARAWLASRSR